MNKVYCLKLVLYHNQYSVYTIEPSSLMHFLHSWICDWLKTSWGNSLRCKMTMYSSWRCPESGWGRWQGKPRFRLRWYDCI